MTREVETFGKTTRELLRLVEWLEKHEITITVMEATGVYWRPVWHILEGHGELVLANAPDRGSGCQLAARAPSRVRAVS